MSDQDWRSLAKNNDWHAISFRSLSPEDLNELHDLLRAFLPKKERGHGIESYLGNIPSDVAQNRAEYNAAILLENIERNYETVTLDDLVEPLKQPFEFAVETLAQMELKFEEWHKTYVYWISETKSWRQISSKEALKIIARRDEELTRIFNLPIEEQYQQYEALDFKNKPWRDPKLLRALFNIDQFERFTPFWHALNILNFCESYESNVVLVRELFEDGEVDEALLSIQVASHAALEVGRSWEALRKKPYDLHALRGLKVKRAASVGGNVRKAQTAPNSRGVIARMKALIEQGKTVSNAAQIAWLGGLGTSASANRNLWYRHSRR